MSKLRKVSTRFAQVAWSVVQDPDLSYTAKGIYAELMSRPDDWKISIEALARDSNVDGRQRIQGAVTELVKAGVYHRVRARRGTVWHTFVYLTPEQMAPADLLLLVDLPESFRTIEYVTGDSQPPKAPDPGHPGQGEEAADSRGFVPTDGSPTTRGARYPAHARSSTSEERLTEENYSPIPTESAHMIVKSWVDWLGERPPGRVVGQVSRLIGEMLAEGIAPAAVKRGLVEMSRRSLNPSVLPSLVHEQQVRQLAPQRTDMAPDRAVAERPTATPPRLPRNWLTDEIEAADRAMGERMERQMEELGLATGQPA